MIWQCSPRVAPTRESLGRSSACHPQSAPCVFFCSRLSRINTSTSSFVNSASAGRLGWVRDRVLRLVSLLLWGSLVTPALWRRRQRWGGTLSSVLPAGLFGWFAYLLGERAVVSEHLPWFEGLGVAFALRFDGLVGTFALLITGVGALVILYAAWHEIPQRSARGFDRLSFAFMTAMLGVVLADDVVTLFVFWELTGLVSYLLIGYESDDEGSRAAARRALLVKAFEDHHVDKDAEVVVYCQNEVSATNGDASEHAEGASGIAEGGSHERKRRTKGVNPCSDERRGNSHGDPCHRLLW